MPRFFSASITRKIPRYLLISAVMMVVPALAEAQTYSAGDYASLLSAINIANSTGGTIVLTSNITLTGTLPTIGTPNFPIVIDGNNPSGGAFTISGNNSYPGLVVSGFGADVTIQNLTIQNTVAQGGSGGGSGVSGGGGGAGLGGALFVGTGTAVTVSNVNLINNAAVGGAGGNPASGGGANGGDPSPGFVGSGGAAGFGTSPPANGSPGTFGGGGGGAGFPGIGQAGGAGGYGGGGGGSTDGSTASGGFGGGAASGTSGGGGAGLGGAVFVQLGGALQVTGAFTLNGNSVTGGAGGSGAASGSGIGSGFFLYGGDVTVTPASGQTITIGQDIADDGSTTGRLTMSGAGGTLVLTGNNTYSGGTSITAGTLSVSTNANLGLGTVHAGDGTTLQLTGSNTFANNLGLVGTVTLNVAAGQTATWSGQVQNDPLEVVLPGALALTGGGTLVLTAANSYSLGTFVAGNSVLVINDDPALGSGDLTLGDASTAGTLTINNPLSVISARNITLNAGGGTINAAGSTDAILEGVISGSGGLTTGGTGTILLNGANTYSGGTIVNAGTLRAGSATAFGASTALTVNSGAIADFNGFNQNFNTIAGSGTIALGTTPSTLTVGSNNASSLFAGTLSGAGGLIKSGTGTLTLSGTNTFTGGLQLQGGTLSVGADANLGGAGTVAMGTGTTLNFTGGGTYAHALTVAGTSSLSAAAGQSVIWGGTIGDGAAGAGTLQLTGGGIFTLTNNANSYSGGTIVAGGSTLNFSGDPTLGAASAGITLGTATSSGTLGFGASATSSRAITLAQGGGAIAASSGTTATINGLIGGVGALQLTGGGIVTLGNAGNSYAGGTIVTGGTTLNFGANGALGAAGSGVTLGDATTTGTLSFGGSTTFARTLTVGQAGGTVSAGSGTTATLSGAINGTGALQLTGGGIFSLNNASNSYSGGTVVTGNSTLNVVGDGSLGAAGAGLTLGNATTTGTLGILTTSTFGRPITLGAAGGIISAGSGTSATLNGVISGAGGLQLTGGGIFALNNPNNSYSGGTIVSGGSILNVGSAGALGATSSLTLGSSTSNGTLGIGGSGVFSAAIALGGAGGTITAGSGSSLTLNGAISGGGPLQFTGGGIFTLGSAGNSYSGATVVTGGSTLNVGPDATLGTTSGVTLGDATSAGTLGLGASGAFSPAISVGAGGGTISAGSGTTTTLNGAIGGTGALQLTGGGIFGLNNANNSYSGGTIVTGGSTLNVGPDGGLGASSGGLTLGDASTSGTLAFTTTGTFSRAITLGAGGGVFDVADGAQGTIPGTIGGSGGLSKTGLGTLNLLGAQSYTGLTWVRQGTLALNATLPGSVQVSPNATLLALGSMGALNLGGTLTVTSPGGTQVAPSGSAHLSSLNGTYAVAPAAISNPLLTINGNLTTTPGSTLNLPLVSGGVAPLQVNGTATLNGTQMNISIANPAPVRTSNYSAISTTGGLQMTGSTVTSNSSSLLPVLVANQYGLAVTVLNLNVPLAPLATSPNGIAVAGALDGSRGVGGDFNNVVAQVTALDNTAFDPALRQLAGEIHATVFHMLDVDSMVFTDLVRGELSEHEHEAESQPATTGVSPNVWFNAGGDHSTFNGGAFSGGTANAGGGGGGIDFRPGPALTIGGGGALSFAGLSLGELSGSSNMTAPRGFAYAGWRFRQFHFHFGWSESHSSATTTRRIAIQASVPDANGNLVPLSGGIDRVATSTQDMTARDFWGEVQYTRKWETYTFDGKFGTRFAHYERSTLEESGADSISLQGASDVLSTRDWNVDLHYFRRSGTWRPNFLFSYRREFGDLSTTANMSFEGNPNVTFLTQGSPIPRDTFEGLVGITMRSGRGLLWTLEYHFFKNSDETRNGLRWKVRL